MTFLSTKKQAPLGTQGRSGWLRRDHTCGPEVLTEDCQDNRRLVTLLEIISYFGMIVKCLGKKFLREGEVRHGKQK